MAALILREEPEDVAASGASEIRGGLVGPMIKLLLDQNTPASVRARVADSIFNHAAKAIEIEDIDARVTELERAAGASKPGTS
jgi:hypothetical protein